MNLYEQYRKGRIDLTPFGIDKGENKSDYFCTPKGAKIIGWTGVDGIHYCTVRTCGETVFVVSPMGDAGRYVCPVARNFEDFLRLLIACGHEAVLAQVHTWPRETYDAYLRDNPVTAAGRECAAHLSAQYALSPIDDPYAYLKDLADGFDDATIPRHPEYEALVCEETPPKSGDWKVYFSCSLGCRQEGERAGKEIPIGKRFSWGELEWFIPCGYTFIQGIVLEVFARADTRRVEDFLQKWAWVEDSERPLSEEEREQCEAENPLDLGFHATLTVNGKPLRQKRSCGYAWIAGRNEEDSRTVADVLDHYGLDKSQCWLFRRIAFPWATKSKPNIRSMSLSLCQRPTALPGIRFHVTEVGDRVEFVHPRTQVRHTLTVTGYERAELELSRTASAAYELPTHHIRMTYTLEPSLSADRYQVRDVRPNDAPRPRGGDLSTGDAACVAIIGGADGPTAMVLGGDPTPPHTACSALTFAPSNDVEWRIVFRETWIKDSAWDLISAT